MASFSKGTSFTDGVTGDVTAAKLHALVDAATPVAGLVTDRTAKTSVVGADLVLLSDSADSNNLKKVSITNFANNLPTAVITNGTVTTLNSTTGTIATATLTNANITAGTVATATLGTTTGTAATFTNGTLTTGVIPTGTFGTTTSTAATITTGTIPTLTIGSTTATAGTVTSLTSSTATITKLTTTLAGDFTITGGTGTLGTTGVTAGTYGTNTAAVTLTLDAKGRVTTVSTSAISTTPADGSITPAKLSQPFTLGTAQNTTSGTAIDFTGIPSWVKRITVMFNGVSANGATGDLLVQIGTSTGIESTGYLAVSDVSAFTAAFGIRTQFASFAVKGAMTITTMGSNIWVMTSNTYLDTGTTVRNGSGAKTLSGTLDRLRVSVGGSDAFDAGSVNIMYEG